MRPAEVYASSARNPLREIPRGLFVAAIVAFVVLAGLYLIGNYRALVQRRVADAKAWHVVGPPCPQITKAEFLKVRHAPARRFQFEGAEFLRRFGHVNCAAIRDNGGRSGRLHEVCQFTSPGDLAVRTPTGDWYFRPGPGRPATISTEAATPACVMASNYRL